MVGVLNGRGKDRDIAVSNDRLVPAAVPVAARRKAQLPDSVNQREKRDVDEENHPES